MTCGSAGFALASCNLGDQMKLQLGLTPSTDRNGVIGPCQLGDDKQRIRSNGPIVGITLARLKTRPQALSHGVSVGRASHSAGVVHPGT